ncbi:MAG: hypothetical protein JO271_04220 [Verrucomicrobia bacterium]|nr:hypothetical protein [Verrucomicrobiota bacterium]
MADPQNPPASQAGKPSFTADVMTTSGAMDRRLGSWSVAYANTCLRTVDVADVLGTYRSLALPAGL